MQHAETKPSEKSHHAGAHQARGGNNHEAKAGPEAAAPVLEGAAQTMARSADAAREILEDWQGLIQNSADMIAGNMMSTAADLKAFSDCATPEDYGRATVAFNQGLAKRWLETGNRFATLSAEYASRRLRLTLDRAGGNGKQRRESH
jgi:hypothetical protein